MVVQQRSLEPGEGIGVERRQIAWWRHGGTGG